MPAALPPELLPEEALVAFHCQRNGSTHTDFIAQQTSPSSGQSASDWHGAMEFRPAKGDARAPTRNARERRSLNECMMDEMRGAVLLFGF